MTDARPILAWLRRDLRLGDHPMLTAAAESGRPVIPVFVCDEVVEASGTAAQWRWGLGLEVFAGSLREIGSRLVLRRGEALPTLRRVAEETGAGDLWWTRLYEPEAAKRDGEVERGLKQRLEIRTFPGHVLFEPPEVETNSGGFYKVFTPYWKAVRGRDPGGPLKAVSRLAAPERWPASDDLAGWDLGAGMRRGAKVVAQHVNVGEASARGRLASFMGRSVERYGELRNLPAERGTSKLSENLTYGEISIRACWHSARRAEEEGKAGANAFRQELAWRDFAHHLVHHTPRLRTGNWREEWDRFPWRGDNAEARAWKRGRTGIRFVDAAMRELYVTGHMHNRSRMVVASYLTKHLMTHWKIGCRWFEDHLIDWDPASNSLGWQWSAGSGPDATPYFRVFNPVTQLDKFDKDRRYVDHWIAEGQDHPPKDALDYFEAIPRRWEMSPDDPYPEAPVVSAREGRQRALSAYESRDF